jgi:hypothetical protein
VRCVRLVLLALAALLTASPAAAQSGDAGTIAYTAILEEGPVERRGIDALAPDVTPHWYGRYRIADAYIDLRYVRSPLAAPADWPDSPCAARSLRAIENLSYYESNAGWSLLVELTPGGNGSGELPPGVTVCRFVDRFVDRHLLFENLEAVTIPGRAPVFPAVIEL